MIFTPFPKSIRMQYLTTWDLILTPIYLVVLIFIAKSHRDKHYPKGHPLHSYYLKGLYLKFGGAIFIALIYQYLYRGGDTFNFFYHAQVINSSLDSGIGTWFKLLTLTPIESAPEIYPYTAKMFWYNDPASYMIASIAAVFGLFNATTYIPIALLFAYFSYTGMWAMFRTFVNIYPKLHKYLAIAFLYIPSTFVWGSAVFKDTVCMFGLGWMTYTTFRIFVNRDFSIRNIFLLCLSFYLMAVIKIYILLAFLPALGLWLLMTYSGKIRSVALRWVTNVFFFALTAFAFFYFSSKFAQELDHYSLENIAKKAKVNQEWIAYVSDIQEGSGYDLGELDGTLQGMLTKFPQAVAVTLFRPFLWEVRKPIVLLSALESFAFLLLTIYTFYKRGIKTVFRNMFRDPNLIFFFFYTLIFAFAVGISTGNFGSLSRYKIPCMPFFAALLLILYFQPLMSKKDTNETRQKRKVHHFA